jgi:hypothetical protein
MQRAGIFYLRCRKGLLPTIWRTADRNGLAPVTPPWLREWLKMKKVDNARILSAEVLTDPTLDPLTSALRVLYDDGVMRHDSPEPSGETA